MDIPRQKPAALIPRRHQVPRYPLGELVRRVAEYPAARLHSSVRAPAFAELKTDIESEREIKLPASHRHSRDPQPESVHQYPSTNFAR